MEVFILVLIVIGFAVLIARAGDEERRKVDKERYEEFKNYKGSESYQAYQDKVRRKKENIEKATAKYENKTKDYPIITTSSSAITKKTCLKTIRGTTLFEGDTTEYGGSKPKYIEEALLNDEIRVNCLTDADIFLRSDGMLFYIQPNWGLSPEYVNPEDMDKWEKIEELEFKYQGAEYVIDDYCPDITNIWQVLLVVKRTGRFCYGNKKKKLKDEMISGGAFWVYWSFFDQFTEQSDRRYFEKLKEVQKKKIEYEEWCKNNPPRTINFNIDDDFYRKFAEARNEIKSYGDFDCFEVLGVDRNVSLSDLKKAYWNLAKKYHPDLNSNDEKAKKKFIEINNAYQLLSDPEKRCYL